MKVASKDDKNASYVQAIYLCLIILLSSCSKVPLQLEKYSVAQKTSHSFKVCHSYGCRAQIPVELSTQEWDFIEAPLKQISNSPAYERGQIAKSIALIEQITGQKIGTDKDVGGATIIGQGLYQMDCIDEAVNTSNYLKFLDNEGLINLHDIVPPARRGTFIDGAWPYNTAVIKEQETGKSYAIDSWFAANVRNLILSRWKTG